MSWDDAGTAEETDHEPSTALTVVNLTFSDPFTSRQTIDDGIRRHSVYLRLSRTMTDYEKRVAAQLISPTRAFGSTLEFSNTTLEEIAARLDDLATAVRRIEEDGKAAELAFTEKERFREQTARIRDAERHRMQDEAANARAAERERLKRLADHISSELAHRIAQHGSQGSRLRC